MSYTETHIRGMAAWIQSRMEKRQARATSQPSSASSPEKNDDQTSKILQSASPEARQLVNKAIGQKGFSLTWDDIGQMYRLIAAPTSYLYPAMAWQDSDLDRLLRSSAWGWASISGNARAMSQLQAVPQEKTGGRWTKAPDDHPLWDFISDPLGTDPTSPFWSWSHLSYVTGLHYYGPGNSFWLPSETRDRLAVFPILDPMGVTAEESTVYPGGVPTLFKLRVRGREFKWKPDQIVNIMAPSASSFWKGSSPLQAALRSVEIDCVATERQRANLNNRVAPGLTVMFDKPMSVNPDQRQKVKDELIDEYQDVTQDGLPWILGSAAKVERGFSSEELQVFDTKHSSREEIMAVIGTQPSIMGQLDRATYSNTKEATLLWWYASIQPVLTLIFGAVNSQLVQRKYGRNTRLWYSVSGTNIGLQLLSALLDVAERLSRLGLSTADIADMLEIEGIPDRDYLKVPLNSWITAGRVEPSQIEEVISQLQKLLE